MMINKLTFFFVFLVIQFLSACSDGELSKEDEVRQFIDAGVLAAENRSRKDLAVLIDEAYKDIKRHDKNKLMGLMQAYFYMHKNIHLFTKYDEIIIQDENRALVTMYVAMAGNVISDVNALASLRAKVYRFELQLIKKEDWLVNSASWQVASLKDMIKVKHAQLDD
ncbi:MAG: hypothetical protein OQK69_04630 [Gammaproteobacteria bacterium]|nr:hypothetical protein [Gammaproteobacteria bacterium]